MGNHMNTLEQLKGLARELNVPVVSLSQLSRAVVNDDNIKSVFQFVLSAFRSEF